MKKTKEKIQQLELQILENHVTKEKELLITEIMLKKNYSKKKHIL
jgi:hypothetical protein